MAKGLRQEENKTGNTTFLQIINGKLAVRVPEGVQGSTKRTNKSGKEVYELLYSVVEGLITNVSISEAGEFGKELHIKLVNEGEVYVIQTGASGGNAFGFLSRVPNINFAEMVELRPYAILDKATNKTKSYFIAYQKNAEGKYTKLDSAFTKENPNGLPELKKIKFQGKDVFDDTDRITFFEQMIYGKDQVNDMLIAMYGVNGKPEPVPVSATEELFNGELSEDNASEYDKAMLKAEEGGKALKAEKKATSKKK